MLTVRVQFMGGEWDVSYEPQEDGDIQFTEIKMGYCTWWSLTAPDDSNALRFMSTVKTGILNAADAIIEKMAGEGWEVK